MVAFLENCPEKFEAQSETIGRRKRGNGLEVPCRHRFVVAKQWLIKEPEGLLQNQVTASVILQTGFLKALTFTKHFPEFNKRHSRLVVTLKQKLHQIA